MPTKVQIYLNSAQDAAAASEAGADFIGVATDTGKYVSWWVPYAEAKAAFDAAGPDRTHVALTVCTDLAEIAELLDATRPDVVHLAGAIIPLERVAALRAARPEVKIMQAIPMNDPGPVEMALAYQQVCDYFLLDTNDPNDNYIGATGKTHDWSISAELVRRVRIPVILAGGLTPETVAEAIRVVRPWGVDSYSHTNYTDRPHVKDPAKIRAFVAAAKGAW
ncbi:MAG: phosphoribosylanthranilate isomerase [Anaerolineae bacterium]|nr:phosphoribosylanthranilate isomerase [Anaerolineae bacterium]